MLNRRTLHCIRIRDDTPQQQYLKLVERYNEELGAQMKEKTARLVEGQNDIIFSIIEESSGSHFDPSLCRAFLQCRLPIETLYNSNLD